MSLESNDENNSLFDNTKTVNQKIRKRNLLNSLKVNKLNRTADPDKKCEKMF